LVPIFFCPNFFLCPNFVRSSQFLHKAQYSEKIQSVLSAFMPSLITAGWNWLSTPAAGANAISPFTSPSLFNIIKMTCGWGLSYVTHFIGFGLIPHYLNKWWAAVKLSALALLEEEKKAAAQADSGSTKRNE
jgi:hypothetical protein